MNKRLRNIPFSPPDMTEAEANEVREAILSGWITTGPRVKKLENMISAYVGTDRSVCLNSATAAMEMALRLLEVGPGDEVIVPAYTYTATASVVRHVGATLVMVDSQTDCVEMDYERLAEAITERTKVIVPVDLGGIVADYDRVFAIVNRPEIRSRFQPRNEIQRRLGRIAVSADCAHSFGGSRHGKQAARLGKHLIVGLNTDDSVKRLKGATRPLNHELDRARVLSALACVDAVVLFGEDTPTELVKKIRPDILVKGGDYKPEEVAGREYAGEVQIIKFEDGYSTTGLLEKVAQLVKEGKL